MKWTFRHTYIFIASFLVLMSLFITDPDNGIIQNMAIGASLVATLVLIVKPILSITILHFSRKGLFDYVDFSKLYEKASETSTGAGLFAIAMAVAMLAIAVVIASTTGQ